MGMHSSVYQYENPSESKINSWLDFNKSILDKISKTSVNGRLLRVQIQGEIDKWTKEQPHLTSLSFYTRLLISAIPRVQEADFLTRIEKTDLTCQRLYELLQISKAAKSNLKSIKKGEAKRGISQLNALIQYLDTDLKSDMESHASGCDYIESSNELRESIEQLIDHINKHLVDRATDSSPILGRAEYARRLALYTDSSLTPEALADMALKEINQVRALMAEVARQYLSEKYPDEPLTGTSEELTKRALADMEKDAPLNAADYLAFWQDLAKGATTFIEKHEIATLPENNTLEIKTAPESAGAAARIGWVASAPPFDPNPVTTLFLPSIPETLPKQEQIDFWASFNKPFNRMIVIHELLPGHYMQMKISRESPHPVRLLFPFGIYTEGWATFTERVLLDAGWEKGQHLTMLAHLRKRLENANRAYTSVKVHTSEWTQAQVMDFSVNTSLVAPQFAKSLWGRLMRSPMQLTSYFLGGAQFSKLLDTERARLGEKFDLKFFMDTIMKSGPIPIDEFYDIFEKSISK
ncbi:MAG: hypothetical protein Roseis2KO_21450 [Roseivirga sp.]